MPNTSWFQPLESQDFLLSPSSYHCKLNVFVFWTAGRTKQAVWRRHSVLWGAVICIFKLSSDIWISKVGRFYSCIRLYACWSCQLISTAVYLLLPFFIFIVNVPLKDYIILFAPFFSLTTFLSVQPFLPRDNCLIHRCITVPPPDPHNHRCLWSRHTFQWGV